jgi:DNA-binding beta-propeller fold protein YncE
MRLAVAVGACLSLGLVATLPAWAGGSTVITGYAGTGSSGASMAGPATSSPLSNPTGVAVDAAGDVYIADTGNNVVEKVTPDGTLSIIAGTGNQGLPTPGPATSSDLLSPYGVAIDSSGNLYIADDGNATSGVVTGPRSPPRPATPSRAFPPIRGTR